MDYKDAGVDVEAGYAAVKLMKSHVARTLTPNVIGDLGSFGGLYSLQGLAGNDSVLVAGTDGVGTKLKLAFALNKHNTVGIDCVAMCANDVVCQGAKPLFFLDYIATGSLDPQQVADIVAGVAEGCVQAGCAIIGGETAEMPGFYTDGEYDMAGFCVGIVERKHIIDGSKIAAGDVLVGLGSSGVHSNGFSLVRKLTGQSSDRLNLYVEELGATIGETLLTPTRIYVKTLLDLMERYRIKGAAHITGGGFIENIPRMIPQGLQARIQPGAWEVLPIFNLLQNLGDLSLHSMYNTFNMGVGMVLCVPASQADAVVAAARELGERASIIGEIVTDTEGAGGIELGL